MPAEATTNEHGSWGRTRRLARQQHIEQLAAQRGRVAGAGLGQDGRERAPDRRGSSRSATPRRAGGVRRGRPAAVEPAVDEFGDRPCGAVRAVPGTVADEVGGAGGEVRRVERRRACAAARPPPAGPSPPTSRARKAASTRSGVRRRGRPVNAVGGSCGSPATKRASARSRNRERVAGSPISRASAEPWWALVGGCGRAGGGRPGAAGRGRRRAVAYGAARRPYDTAAARRCGALVVRPAVHGPAHRRRLVLGERVHQLVALGVRGRHQRLRERVERPTAVGVQQGLGGGGDRDLARRTAPAGAAGPPSSAPGRCSGRVSSNQAHSSGCIRSGSVRSSSAAASRNRGERAAAGSLPDAAPAAAAFRRRCPYRRGWGELRRSRRSSRRRPGGRRVVGRVDADAGRRREAVFGARPVTGHGDRRRVARPGIGRQEAGRRQRTGGRQGTARPGIARPGTGQPGIGRRRRTGRRRPVGPRRRTR